MKIRVSYTVDIDPDAWFIEFGRTDVRIDVQERAKHLAVEQFRMDGVLAE